MIEYLYRWLLDRRTVRLPFLGEIYARIEEQAEGLPFFEMRREREDLTEIWAGSLHITCESWASFRRIDEYWEQRYRKADEEWEREREQWEAEAVEPAT